MSAESAESAEIVASIWVYCTGFGIRGAAGWGGRRQKGPKEAALVGENRAQRRIEVVVVS